MRVEAEHLYEMFGGVSVWDGPQALAGALMSSSGSVWTMRSCFSSCLWPHRKPPPEASELFMLATMTAVSKKDGGVRGIATGTSFRRLVAKSLARQFGAEVERGDASFQFALSTRAGTDCVGHAARLATDPDPRATVLSIDGVGAHDHVLRSAMLGKLLEVDSLRGLLPFVRATYAQPSCCHWQDDHGRFRQIRQHEGGEQGDPLMPLLFCLAVHSALMAVQEQLLPGECIFAFLDDVYALSSPGWTCAMYKLLEKILFAIAGIRLHTGKTRTWSKAGEIPECMEELGDEVESSTGINILGTPVGSEEFHLASTRERLAEEEVLWRAIPWAQDLQCASQLLVQCAGPRCHHFVRTVPPSLSAVYAEGHDRGMQATMATLDVSQQRVAGQLATLPMRIGGLAARIAPAAYWASWGVALHMIPRRLSQIANSFIQQVENGEAVGCVGELQNACRTLDRSGFVGRPTWAELKSGARPPPVSGSMAGSTTRLPLSNTIIGRPQCLPSLLLPIRPTCVPTQDLERARFCAARRQSQSSRCSQTRSAQ